MEATPSLDPCADQSFGLYDDPLAGSYFMGDGAAYRTRTCDPLITNEVLYQLS